MKPERMPLMEWTTWPSCVDEEIVDVLLRILDDSLKVLVGPINELPQALGIVNDKLIVLSSDRRVEVAQKQVHHQLLVGVSHRHSACCGFEIVHLTLDRSAASGAHEPIDPARRLERMNASCVAASSYTPSASSCATAVRLERRQSGP